MSRSVVGLLVAASLVGIGFACIDPDFPGEQVMGTFTFNATPLQQGCTFEEQPDGGFRFDATFSRAADNSKAWMTLQGVNREAEFDGQFLLSRHEAPRRFARCDCDTTVVKETIRVAILSESQLAYVQDAGFMNPDGGVCPTNALDGGLPADVEGVTPPGPREGGDFDAVRACGVLVDEVVPGEGCKCEACTLVYEVAGGAG